MRFPLVLSLALTIACQSGDREVSISSRAVLAAVAQKYTVTYAENGTPEGLPRFHKWSATHFQGAQPEGEIAFRNLAALGVTTIISVDGAIPDLESAHKYGLTYAHVPFGYDGVPREQALKIIRAAKSAKGGVYLHCHHGKHRGPAGMMALRIALDKITNEEAVAELKASGTSALYEGLYSDIANFKAPTEEELSRVTEPVPEKVVPHGLQASMVDVSHRFEMLKKSRAAGWSLIADSPDVSPPHEARMLWELFRESARAKHGAEHGPEQSTEFARYLSESEAAAKSLEKALRANDQTAADQHYKVLRGNCKSCHSEYRN